MTIHGSCYIVFYHVSIESFSSCATARSKKICFYFNSYFLTWSKKSNHVKMLIISIYKWLPPYSLTFAHLLCEKWFLTLIYTPLIMSKIKHLLYFYLPSQLVPPPSCLCSNSLLIWERFISSSLFCLSSLPMFCKYSFCAICCLVVSFSYTISVSPILGFLFMEPIPNFFPWTTWSCGAERNYL
jgi:hypothetical protein